VLRGAQVYSRRRLLPEIVDSAVFEPLPAVLVELQVEVLHTDLCQDQPHFRISKTGIHVSGKVLQRTKREFTYFRPSEASWEADFAKLNDERPASGYGPVTLERTSRVAAP
jgi:hypothetical protein